MLPEQLDEICVEIFIEMWDMVLSVPSGMVISVSDSSIYFLFREEKGEVVLG